MEAAEEIFPAANGQAAPANEATATVTPKTTEINDVGERDSGTSGTAAERSTPAASKSTGEPTSEANSATAQPKTRRLKVNVEALPDDLEEARFVVSLTRRLSSGELAVLASFIDRLDKADVAA